VFEYPVLKFRNSFVIKRRPEERRDAGVAVTGRPQARTAPSAG